MSRTEAGDAITDLVLLTFRLNGQFLAAAEEMAQPVGLTAAWWQVLGAVLPAPNTVAEIARHMGLSRQGVQRIADLLVDRGFAEYRPNPAHRRAKLFAVTDAGLAAIQALAPAQHAWADAVAGVATAEELRQTCDVIRRVLAATERRPVAD